ncbi:MAG: hypothetical protein WDZ28_05570 [Simkaniaceae bacterium]
MKTSNTIDKLPDSAHVRWIDDQKAYDKQFVQDSNSIVPFTTDFSSVTPLLESEFARLFGLDERNRPFAHFTSPIEKNRKLYFTRRGLVPNIQSAKLFDHLLTLFDDEKNEKEFSKIILDFLDKLKHLDTLVETIYNDMAKLQRG